MRLTPLFGALLRVHLFCALSATAVFWVAGLSPRGGRTHRAAGRLFARFIYAAALTGGTLAVAELVAPGWVHISDAAVTPDTARAALAANRQTMWLVLYLLLIIVAPVQHGLAAVAAGPSPARVRSRTHATVNVLSMAGTLFMLAASVVWQQWTYLIVVPIGFIIGLRNMSYASRSGASPVEWEREHLTSLITAGITLHTAFFVFGTSRSLGWQPAGAMALLPWLAPALVGLPLIAWLRTTAKGRGTTRRP